RSFGRLFVWAVPILAAYGIYQFVRLPAWDAAWLQAARMNSVGPAIPFAFRVFGSLNTPGPFALVLLVVILASLGLKSRFQWVSLTLGVVAILLTRVRSSWVVFPIGLVVLQFGSSLRKLPKQWLIIIAVGALVLPVLNLADSRGSVLRRIMSLSDISEDRSFQRRVALTRGFANEIVDRAEGNGLGATGGASKLKSEVGVRSLDNGVLEVLFTLGWLGGMLYYSGFVILVGRVMTSINVRGDPFLAGVRAASAALTITLPVNEIFAGVIGHLTMMLIGLAMAARVHQVTVRHARILAMRRPR
ncbi:MAG: hypothetical protein K2X99_08265, partial [Gemmatimonadaceae bacterium]|nr:hypothetical protein [Gemmatimonadaceae bacterium]